jgi:hypothetical protein
LGGFRSHLRRAAFRPLKQIDESTVRRLRLAWWFDLPRGNSVTGALEVDGTIFVAIRLQLSTRSMRKRAPEWAVRPKAAEAAGSARWQGWAAAARVWNGKSIGTQDGRRSRSMRRLESRLERDDARDGDPGSSAVLRRALQARSSSATAVPTRPIRAVT